MTTNDKVKPFQIMAHRGFWGGNIIQNTRQAAKVAKLAGADIVEIDICRSSDGVYYLFHDGNELKLLNQKNHFTQLSSYELDKMQLINAAGANSGYPPERFEDFLNWLPDNYTVNIDRSWNYWNEPDFFNIIRQSGKIDQLIIKSYVEAIYLDSLQSSQLGIKYIPILESPESFNLIDQYPDINLYGVEVVIRHPNHGFTDQWIDDIGHRDLHIMVNAENLGPSNPLFAGHHDDGALLGTVEDHWGQMLRFGATIIQTDWPNFLHDYRCSLMS